MSFRAIIHRIFNRFTVVVILCFLQVLLFAQILLNWSNYYVFISEGFKVISILVVFYLIYKQENPSVKLAWIVPILLFPILGGISFILFGHATIPHKMKNNMLLTYDNAEKAHEGEWTDNIKSVDELCENDSATEDLLPADVRNECRYIERFGRTPVWTDTATKYFDDGIPYWDSLAADLENAKEFIFPEYFIIGKGVMWDRILEILKRKADEGLDVRVIYDDVGSVFVIPNHYERTLEAMGIKCVDFNRLVPFMHILMNNRDHRKIVVIDGRIGYTGGINLSDEYINVEPRFGYWKDAGIRIEGNAVWNFTVMFLQMWNTCRMTENDYKKFRRENEPLGTGGVVLPFGDTPLDDEPLGENIYLNMIASAQKYLYVFTPYLITDNELLTAFKCAAKRGVDVRIVTPGTPDKKIIYLQTQANYPTLIKAGVKIFQYNKGFIHSKCVLSDDTKAIVGTINFDYRSFVHHFEDGVYMYKTEVVDQLKKDMDKTFGESDLITMDYFAKKRFQKHILLPVIKLISPLL